MSCTEAIITPASVLAAGSLTYGLQAAGLLPVYEPSLKGHLVLEGVLSCMAGVALGRGVEKSLSIPEEIVAPVTAFSIQTLLFALRQGIYNLPMGIETQEQILNTMIAIMPLVLPTLFLLCTIPAAKIISRYKVDNTSNHPQIVATIPEEFHPIEQNTTESLDNTDKLSTNNTRRPPKLKVVDKMDKNKANSGYSSHRRN